MEHQQTDQPAALPNPAPKKKGRWWKRLLLLLFLALVFFVLGYLPYFLVDRVVIRGFALPDKDNEEFVKNSFTVPREDITLQTSDGVQISGWWIPADHPRGTVVLIHGLNRRRIEMARKVEPLHDWGFNCILIDLRHHGASGVRPITFGLTEKLDVKAAVDFARRSFDGPVVLWGVSLGGASATLAAADDPGVAGLISDSSYDTLPNSVRHHLSLARSFRPFGLPLMKLIPTWPTSSLVLFWMRQRGHFEPEAVDVLGAASKMRGRPSLFVANRGDIRIPFTIAEEMAELAGPLSHVLLTDSKSHGGAWRDAREAYEAAVKGLLDQVVPPVFEDRTSKVETQAKTAGRTVVNPRSAAPERTPK